jgi:2-methylcitrate dehydratase PrpD
MNPKTGLEGKFSFPYTVTNAILRDETGIKAFNDDKVNDNDIIRLCKKVEVINEPKLQGFNSIVRISIDGKLYEKQINIFNLNLRYDEKKQNLLKKFNDLAEIYVGKENTQEIINRIKNLEQQNNIIDIVHLCTV